MTQWEPKYLYVDITLEKQTVQLGTIQVREPTAEELAEQGREAMEWFRSRGHECNPGCNPPFAHMCSGAYESVVNYLSEVIT